MKFKSKMLFVPAFTLLTAQTAFAAPPIIGGFPVDNQDQTEVRRSTVALITTVYDEAETGKTTGAGCSGTLVNDHFILTARHCFTGSLAPTNMVPNASHKVIFSTDYSNGKSFIFNSKAVTLAKSTYLDLALIDLSTVANFEVPSDYKSAKIYSAAPLSSDALVTLAGFGIRSDNYESIQNNPALVEDLGYGQLYQVDGHVYGYGVMSLDVYGRNFNTAFDSRKSDEILISGNGKTGTCHGDSGGPTYVKMNDGSYQVVGVTSWGLPLFNESGDPIDGSCDTTQPDREIYLGGATAKTWLTSVLGQNY